MFPYFLRTVKTYGKTKNKKIYKKKNNENILPGFKCVIAVLGI